MLPESNAPKEANPWVRNVSNRALSIQSAASRAEANANALASANRSAMALVSSRVENVDSFTTGLFEQDSQVDVVNSWAALNALPVLYEYTDGNFRVVASVTKRIPFSRYNELTVTADGRLNSWTTSAGISGISSNTCIPMIQATIPPLSLMLADGRFLPNSLTYASRWTVENFEPFAGYNIPGNVAPTIASSSLGFTTDGGYHPEFSPSIAVTSSLDNSTGYSMRYTRQWLSEYMEAIREYTTTNNPPPAGARYYAPDVNMVEIVVGYYFREFTSTPGTTLYINDNRLSFTSSNTFSFEGVRNMGY